MWFRSALLRRGSTEYLHRNGTMCCRRWMQLFHAINEFQEKTFEKLILVEAYAIIKDLQFFPFPPDSLSVWPTGRCRQNNTQPVCCIAEYCQIVRLSRKRKGV